MSFEEKMNVRVGGRFKGDRSIDRHSMVFLLVPGLVAFATVY